MKSEVFYLTKSNRIVLLENGLLYFTGLNKEIYIVGGSMLAYVDFVYLGNL